MGLWTDIVAVCSDLCSVIHKREEKSLEDFYINRFGKKNSTPVFRNTIPKISGDAIPARYIPAGAHSVQKDFSVFAIIKHMFGKLLPNKENRHVETSLIELFSYPK